MKKFILCAFVLFNLAFAKELKIGVVLPLTGPVAAYGQDLLLGLKLANEYQSKLKNGDEVKLIIVDTKGDKIEAKTAATRLVAQDKVIALIGEATTTNTMQAISVAESQKVPLIAPVASGDKLLNNKFYSSRVCFMDSFQGQKFADFALSNLKAKTAVLITDQSNVYSLGLGRVFENEFSKKGGKIVKKFSISSNDKDFKAIVSQLSSINADLVYMPIYHPEAALIAKQARAIGFKGQFAAGDGVNNTAFVELGGDAVEGVIFTDSFDAFNPPNQTSKDFLALYEKQSGKKELPAFSAMAADAYLVMLNALNTCENSLTSECVNNAIHSTKNLEVVGGTINIDKSGNASRSVVVKQIKDGKQAFKALINP